MANPSAWGIAPGYHDVVGGWHEPSQWTVQALLSAMHAEADEPDAGPALWFVREGEAMSVAGRWELQTEDGGSELVSGTLPPVPLGYHHLYRDDGRGVRLIVTPGRCHWPEGLRTWGWSVQLYSLWSGDSQGIGDYHDLARLCDWSAANGAGVVLCSPLHAPAPVLSPVGREEPSPYSPSSRCFRNPLHLRVDGLSAFAPGPLVDRSAVWDAKLAALNDRWRRERRRLDAGFDAFVVEGGELLERWATFAAIAEVHGPSWRRWPPDLRRSDASEVRQLGAEYADRVRFHQWLQWLVDIQLAGGAQDRGDLRLFHDLAVGSAPDGADTWMWPDLFAEGVTAGAPPDEFARDGQDWNIAATDPWRLRAAGYEPWVQMLRSAFRHAGGLRIDHVMGLFRLFWIPRDGRPSDGAYVRYPAKDLLDLLALESHRAGALVVGEDLGTVEAEVRQELEHRNVASTRVWWFEDTPPSRWPERAVASVGTHDLPTVAGVSAGSDPDAWRLADRLTGQDVTTLHRDLARGVPAVVLASLEDALGVEHRPNQPGTEVPTNWSRPLPQPLEQIEVDARVVALIAAMREARPP